MSVDLFIRVGERRNKNAIIAQLVLKHGYEYSDFNTSEDDCNFISVDRTDKVFNFYHFEPSYAPIISHTEFYKNGPYTMGELRNLKIESILCVR
jgi:hypothetical protein